MGPAAGLEYPACGGSKRRGRHAFYSILNARDDCSMHFCWIIRFRFLQCLLLSTAEDKWTTLASLHAFIDILPEAPEVIHRRNQRNGHHEPYGHARHQIYI